MAKKLSTAARERALQRSISQLAIGVVRDVDRVRRRDNDNRMLERVEEFQIQGSGVAADIPDWALAEITFDIAYTQGSGNRTSDLQRPQVSFGFEQTRGVSESSNGLVPVIASVVVVDWSVNDQDLIDGCTVACAAIAPDDEVNFQGFFHLTIQGYGAPLEDTDTED